MVPLVKKHVTNMNNIIEKSTIEIKYLIKKCIENRETVNSSDKDHTKIKKLLRRKKSIGKKYYI